MNLTHSKPCRRLLSYCTHLPSTTTIYRHISTLLSSCKSLNTLYEIHAHLITMGHAQNPHTTTHLMNLYSSFGKPNLSRKIFDSTPNPDLIQHNTLIRAYNKAKQYEEALQIYHLMLQKSMPLDNFTFTFALKACIGLLDFENGILVHKEIVKQNLECDVYIATGLINMYINMGDMNSAKMVFDKMRVKDVATWNVMISGLSKSHKPYEAVYLFKSMQIQYQVKPNEISLLNLLPAVGKLKDVKVCRCIHGYVCRRAFKTAVTNGLIDMYSKCGYSDVARRIFDRMMGRDDVSFGTMMAGYVYTGKYFEVLELFDYINKGNLKLDKVSAVSALLAAGEVRDYRKGMEIHDYAIRQRIISDVMVATSLMTMYAKFGEVEKVKELFVGMQGRDLVAWSAVIAAFAQSGYPEEALSLFRDMQNEKCKPNPVTLVSILPACAELSSVKQGKSLHCYAIKAGMDSDITVGTALVSMYAKCDSFASALVLFSKMPSKEVVTWNTLINGYAQVGDAYNVIEMYCQLKLSGLHPDAGTMVGLLPACALLGDRGKGTCIHGQIIKYGFESDSHVRNALIDMYAKCGSLQSAEFLFSQHESCQDKICWNTMIAGYVQNNCAKEAIAAFRSMKMEGLEPNLITIVSVLPATSHLTDLREGLAIHSYIIKRGFQSFTVVANSLIDMYGKCGLLDYSQNVFDEMEKQDIVSWNVMLATYSIHGHSDRALNVFSLMQENMVEMDSVSFINILSACRHAGLIEEGRKIFHSMQKIHHVKPTMEHFACMVDLLGRAGLFDEILELLHSMPMQPDAKVWGALLSACKMHSNVKLGEIALQHLTNLERDNPASYVVLSTIYSQTGRWADARNTRLKMKTFGLRKNPGCSWVEVRKAADNGRSEPEQVAFAS